MIRIGVKQGVMGEGSTTWREVEWRDGITVADIRDCVGQVATLHVAVGVDGRQLEDDDLVPDGATCVVCPVPGETILGYVVYAIISAIVSLAVNYVVSLLTPTPKPPGVPQQRGDEESPTFTWNGIQTSYGQGQVISVVLGRHAVGGQVIYSSLRPWVGGAGEVLVLDLALSEGPIHRIGNYEGSRNDLGGIDFFGSTIVPPVPGLPTGFYINDNLQDATGSQLPDVMVWTRNGTLRQSPLPASRFPGAATLFTINSPLNEQDDEYVFTYSGTESLNAIAVTLQAPGGLYEIAAGGAITGYGVQVTCTWRYVGETAWRQFFGGGVLSAGGGNGYTSSHTWGAALTLVGGADVTGPIEIRVVRNTPSGSVTSIVSQTLLRSVETIRPQEFSYPGVAHMGVAILATGATSGALPRFKQVCDGILVRVWDAVAGFSEYVWDAPTEAPFDFCTQPPGRSPAWLLGEFAVNQTWGMGNELDDTKVDWPKLREWAAYCQTIPGGGWVEPRFLAALVLDVQRPAWDIVLALCMAGRAAPVWRDGKLSVEYQYRDAHGDSGVSVPAKVPVQLVTSSLCENVTVRWLEKKGRATAINFQFLNEDEGFAQAVEPVEDSETNVNDPTDPNSEPFITQTIQAWGVTSRSQLVRQGFYLHRQTRLIRRELTFECGPWMLAAEVGQLFDFQHDLLRPFDDDVATTMQVVEAAPMDTRVLVDHKVVIPTGETLHFAARLADGSPIYRTVTSVTATTRRGRQCTWLFLAGDPFTVAPGAACAVGLADKIVQTYQIVSLSLSHQMRRVVRAVQWVPELFDDVPSTAADVGGDSEKLGQSKSAPRSQQIASDINLQRSPEGFVRLSWSRAVADDRGQRARVYAKPSNVNVWTLLGETKETQLDVVRRIGWRTAKVAVVLEGTDGTFEPPEFAPAITAEMPEFPPVLLPAPGSAQAVSAPEQNQVTLTWSAVEATDVVGYEVRVGEDWAGGKTVWRGTEARAVLSPAPAHGTLQIAARHSSGLYGKRTTLSLTVDWLPQAGAQIVDSHEYAPTQDAAGTKVNTKFDPEGWLNLHADFYRGTFTSEERDLGYQAPFFLRVALAVHELDHATVGELSAIQAGSGEAFWRTVDTRPASPMHPGINWSLKVSDVQAKTFEELAPMLASGLQRGEPGSHVRCDVESRVYVDGAWSDWSPHVDRKVECSRWQARLQFGRTTRQREVRATTFRMETLI